MKEAYGGVDEGIEWTRCEPRDFSKLNIKDGVIYYKLYNQDGTMTEMTVADTYSNRLFVSMVQIHDRYVNGPEWKARDPKIGTVVCHVGEKPNGQS